MKLIIMLTLSQHDPITFSSSSKYKMFPGKTTLATRLRDNQFDKSPAMTHGINMTKTTIGDIDFLLLDFAGQEEYLYTHSLFFDDAAIFLAVHNGRTSSLDPLEMGLDMIKCCASSATIIVATTRRDDGGGNCELSDDKKQYLTQKYPNIKSIIAVDSMTGYGIEELKRYLSDIDTSIIPSFKIPNSYYILQDQLQKLSDQTIFSITQEEALQLAKRVNIDTEVAKTAISMFLSWGTLFRLSNGDLVLAPQQLADVMACVFKTSSALDGTGSVKDGILSHNNKCLHSIWGDKFKDNKSLWSWQKSVDGEVPEEEPPFLHLLYIANLAYRLYDENGESLKASLIPAKLSVVPDSKIGIIPINDADLPPYILKVQKKFLPNTPASLLQQCLTLRLLDSENLPKVFFARLQVALQRLTIKGASWRHGLIMQGGNGESYIILMERKNSIIIHSIGKAKFLSEALLGIKKLNIEFGSLKWKDLTLSSEGDCWDLSKLSRAVKRRKKLDRNDGSKLSTASFKILFEDDGFWPNIKEYSSTEISDLFGEEKPPQGYDLIMKLATHVLPYSHDNSDCNDDDSYETDMIQTDDKLEKCTKTLLTYLYSFRFIRCPKALWILFEKVHTSSARSNNTGKNEYEKKDLSDGKSFFFIPVSPGENRSKGWHLVMEAKIEVRKEHINGAKCNDSKTGVINLLKQTFNLLETYIPNDYALSPLCIIGDEYYVELIAKENEHFVSGERMLDKDTHKKYHGMSSVASNDNELLKILHELKKMKKLMVTEFDKVHESIGRLSVGLESATKEIKMRLKKSEKLSIQSTWSDQIMQLESIFENYASKQKEEVSSLIVNLFSEKTEEMCFQVDAMKIQLQTSKDELVKAVKEDNIANCDSILSELRKVQTQLSTVIHLSEENNKEMKEGLKMLQNTLVDINQRNFPTMFVVIDRMTLERMEDAVDNGSEYSKYQKLSESVFSRASSLLSKLSNPLQTLSEVVNESLREKEYIALVCEVCRVPQGIPDKCYTISNPKEVVGKILPLAKAGVKLVYMANTISSVGKMFGLPTPTISDSMDGVKAFLDDLGQSSLENFSEIQKKVHEAFSSNDDESLNAGETSNVPKKMSPGYCEREFRRFLKSVDPEDDWCSLCPYSDDEGHIFFACKNCVSSN